MQCEFEFRDNVKPRALIPLDDACSDFASQQPTSNVAKWWTPLKVMVSFVSEIPSANELGIN